MNELKKYSSPVEYIKDKERRRKANDIDRKEEKENNDQCNGQRKET